MGDDEPQPVKKTWVVVTVVVEDEPGKFSVAAFDPVNACQLAQVPEVPDAKDWADALIQFWTAVRSKVIQVMHRESN